VCCALHNFCKDLGGFEDPFEVFAEENDNVGVRREDRNATQIRQNIIDAYF